MAVALKLSRKLYETLGDEAAEAMVGWMDSVEHNRAELREVNDLAFARIDARFGEAEARIDLRFVQLEARIDRKCVEMDARFIEMEARFDAKLNQRIAELREEMLAGFARLERMILQTDAKIDQRFADLLKWSFTFWIGSTVMLAATLVAFARWGH